MRYRVSGRIRLKGERTFSKQVEAESERMAREKLYAFFGNVYGIRRRDMTIEEIKKF